MWLSLCTGWCLSTTFNCHHDSSFSGLSLGCRPCNLKRTHRCHQLVGVAVLPLPCLCISPHAGGKQEIEQQLQVLRNFLILTCVPCFLLHTKSLFFVIMLEDVCRIAVESHDMLHYVVPIKAKAVRCCCYKHLALLCCTFLWGCADLSEHILGKDMTDSSCKCCRWILQCPWPAKSAFMQIMFVAN